jgi:hypothetical protein
LRAPERWQRVAKFVRDTYEDAFIILDNSLIELGYPLPPADLLRGIEIVQADVIVLPDYLTECDRTLEASKRGIEELTANGLPSYCSMLGVVQGKTWDEYHRCARELVGMGCNHLSIPRITRKVLGSRIQITGEIAERSGKSLHLLGFSDDLMDDLNAALNNRAVMGIDSTEPLRLGRLGLKYSDTINWSRIPPRDKETYLDEPGFVTPEMEYNLNWIRKVIS